VEMMEQLLMKALAVAYASIGVVGFLAYWPTIKDLYYHKKPSANISSYVLWVGTTGITFLYSLFLLPDLLFRMVSAMNFLACSVVLLLSVGLKRARPIKPE